MAHELVTYAGLAQRLNISTAAAKALAKGLKLTRYAAPDEQTLLLVDLSRLRGAGFADDDTEDQRRRPGWSARKDTDNDAHAFDVAPRRLRRPNPRRAMRAQIVASLHERIEDIQRQLDRVEAASDDQSVPGPDSHMVAELFRVAAHARQTAEQAREGLTTHRSRRWWKRASA